MQCLTLLYNELQMANGWCQKSVAFSFVYSVVVIHIAQPVWHSTWRMFSVVCHVLWLTRADYGIIIIMFLFGLHNYIVHFQMMHLVEYSYRKMTACS